MREETIAVIAFNGISPFHLSVPCAVFGEDRTGASMPKIKLLVCAAERGVLHTTAGFSIEARYGLKALSRATIIIVPSWRDTAERPPRPLLDALRRASERGALIVGLCLGSYVLAAAGLLDGRAATTHWFWAEDLARRYPGIRVNPDVLYVDDGNIITSAGTAPRLIAACTFCAGSTAESWQIRWRGAWLFRRIARAGRRNLSSSRCATLQRRITLPRFSIGSGRICSSRTAWTRSPRGR